MKIISLYSPKGGVGKTTIAVNLAGAYAAAGKSVILVDRDEQESAFSIYSGPAASKAFDVVTEFPENPSHDIMIIDQHPSHKEQPVGAFIICPIEPCRLSYESYAKARHLFKGKKHIVVPSIVDRRITDHMAFVKGIKKEVPILHTVLKRHLYRKSTNRASTIFEIGRAHYGMASARAEINRIKETADKWT